LLRRADFQKVYQNGTRLAGPFFTAFYLGGQPGEECRVGFTVPRAVGKAVVRNRIKRRMREAVRLRHELAGKSYWIVFNPRRSVLGASFPVLLKEVERLLGRCAG
jgi:ribonuclease P protein component